MRKYLALRSNQQHGTAHPEMHELFSTADIQRMLETARQARANFTEPGPPAGSSQS